MPQDKAGVTSGSPFCASMLFVRAETTMAERRQVERLKSTSGALLFSEKQRGVFSCALRDISDSGVGLQLNERDVVPQSFKITLDNFRNVETCQVVWSRGRYIGATFQR
jgi:PilZ domain